MPKTKEVLHSSGERAVTFVHLLGNHSNFKYRYPRSYQQWPINGSSTSERFKNSYKNSVLYNDYIVSELIKLSVEAGYDGFIYFSDHGEEVYDFRDFIGHSASMLSRYMVEVPFVFYFKDKKISKDILDRPYALEDFPHLLLGLLNINSPLYRADRDLLSKDYIVRNRKVLGRVCEVELQRKLNKEEFQGLLGSHRTNSINKIKALPSRVSCVEVDVMFKGGKFIVAHDDKDFKGLMLSQWLAKFKSDKFLWLDFKNLSKNNQSKSLKELKSLSDSYSLIRDRVLVESTQVNNLGEYTKSGFKTAYYLPTDLHDKQQSAWDLKAKTIVNEIKLNHISSISFDNRLYDFVKTNLEGNIPSSLSYFSWDVSSSKNNIIKNNVALLADKKLKCLLTKKQNNM